jgi:ABC-type lipoprotein release transport system permease subunit
MWTGHLVRRGWRATIFLALLAGLAAGVAMAACAAGRRTATAFDRFLAYAETADLIVTFCPPGHVVTDEESLQPCFAYDAKDEVAVLNELPEIDVAARASFRGLTAARPTEPDRLWLANASIVEDEGLRSFEGEQILVEGRWFAPTAADEVVVNERFVEESGIDVGEELILTYWAPDEVATVPEDGERLHGPTTRVRVVGVVRGLLDIAAGTRSISRVIDEVKVIGGPALAAATADAGSYGGVLVRARDGDDDTAGAAIERSFAGRMFNIGPAGGAETAEIGSVREAIRYEANAAMAFGIIAAIASAVFVGQAVARQSRREWSDLSTLRALGMANRDVRWAAGLRGAVVGAAAALVAATSAVALSPLGPIGVGRRAEVDPGPSIDWAVVLAGTLGVLAVVIVASCLPLRRHGVRAGDAAPSANRRLGVRGVLPPVAVAGLGMTVNGRRDGRGIPMGAALSGVALAVGAVVAAAGVSMSLDVLTRTPERFGASWDASIAYYGGDVYDRNDELGELLGDESMIAGVAGIVGTDVEIGDEAEWIQAFRPLGTLDGIRPVITAGREPLAIDEIALGSVTKEHLGVEIGDTVEVRNTAVGRPSTTMTVVGTTIVNDTYEASPGRGGVVTPEWMETYAREASADPIVVRLQPGVDVDTFRLAVDEQTSAFVSPPVRHGAIRNLERIATLPFLLAALVGVLAIASLAHALTLSIGRSGDQLAVWKSIGFTRRQVRVAGAWHASTLAVAATAAGVPLGVVLGRLGWKAIADQMGVPNEPVTSVSAIAAAALGAVIVANMLAAYPAWRAARVPTAEALRAE